MGTSEANNMEKDMEVDVLAHMKMIDIKIEQMKERIDKLREIIFAYMEAGSNIALSSVKANLKSI